LSQSWRDGIWALYSSTMNDGITHRGDRSFCVCMPTEFQW